MDQDKAPAIPHVNPWIIAIAVMLSTFMEVLDTTVVNVSLPHIAGNLSATVDEVTWTLTSYLVSNAIILPLTGWLGNFFGRKRLMMISVAGFTAALFLCGLAPNLPALIVFRVIQGACGGGLQPISQAVLLESFAPKDRGKAMGFWGLGIVVAPTLGPLLGGSIGIAAVDTMQVRREQAHINTLGWRVNAYNHQSQTVLNGLRGLFMSGGAAVWGMVEQQARMMSYNDAFRLLAIMFLCMLPFILLIEEAQRQWRTNVGALIRS